MKKIFTLHQAKLPKMLGDLVHSNQFLKVFSLVTLLLALVSTTGLFIVAIQGPHVIALSTKGKILEEAGMPKAEDQVREAVEVYVSKRYQWGPSDVVKNLKESESFIMPNTLKAFKGSVSNVAKFSVEKIVSQKIYVEDIKVNFAKQTALITGDRVTSIQGMKAAGSLKLELSFESGPRTIINPWGVYISKEREE